MQIVKCGKCGAQFDVSTMRPGSAFACGKCRNAVQVPAAPPPATVAMTPEQVKRALEHSRAPAAAPAPAAAAPKAQPKLPPAMQKRAQATGAPTRAAGAAPAAPVTQVAAAEPARPAAKHARPVSSAPVKKTPVALYAGIGVVVVGGIAAYLAMSGGEKPKEAPKPLEAPKTTEPPPAPKVKDATHYEDFLTMTTSEQDDSLKSRFLSAGTDAAKLKELYDWLTHAKVATNASAKSYAGKVVEAALKADAACAWAHEARGDKRLDELLKSIKDECKNAFDRPDKEERAIASRLDTLASNPYADAAEWTKFSGLAATVRNREKRMTEDPRYLEAENKRAWVRVGPMFKDVELTWTFADPYVIFQEVRKQDVRDTKSQYNEKSGRMEETPVDGTSNPSKVAQNEEWARKGKLFAERDAIMFTELNRRFRELFAERYKLPTLKEKGRLLTGLVMWNRESFDKLLAAADRPVSAFVRAFYSPPERKIFHYLSDESLQSLDEIKCEGGYVQKLSDQVTFHEGTHQLQHEYSAIYRGTPLRDDEVTIEPRRAMWFEEGIAEFMGSCEVEDGKTEFLKDVHWRHNRILLERVAEARSAREHTELWTIAQFLKPNDNNELQNVGQQLAPGDLNMPSHFYCRVWAFCHFLWYYDNGKYRPKFYDYLEEVMKGTQSSDKFAKIMGRPSTSDWGDIEKEYEWYWTKLLERKVGRDKVTKQWFLPSTEAPAGKVEDDADFLDYWKENHKK